MKVGENEDEYGLFLPGMAVVREFSHGNRERDEPHEECCERDLKEMIREHCAQNVRKSTGR